MSIGESVIETEGTVSDEAKAYIQTLDVPGDPREEEAPEQDADEEVSPDEPTETAEQAEPVETDEDNWIDEEIKELAKAYGISEEKLAKLESRDEFDKFASLYEDKLIGEGKKFLESLQQPNTAQAAEAPAPAQPTEQAPVAQQPLPPAIQEVMKKVAAISADDYGPELSEAMGGVAQLVHQQQAVINDLVQYVQQQVQQTREETNRVAMQNEINTFNQSVSALGHNDLFGDDLEKLTQSQWDNRNKVLQAAVPLQAALSQQAGRMVPLTKSLIKRAAHAVFHDQFINKAVKDTTEGIRKQSAKRLGGATRKQKFETRDMPKSRNLLDDKELLASARDILDRPPSDD
jgi:hypothetical protein